MIDRRDGLKSNNWLELILTDLGLEHGKKINNNQAFKMTYAYNIAEVIVT